MTLREYDRATVMGKIAEGRISQAEAAGLLNVSVRQVKRLYKRYKDHGVKGLRSKKRGQTSNNRLPETINKRVIELVTCELYKGFRPTFMCEKLKQLHKIEISRETTRKLMIASGVWQGKEKKRPVVHQQRLRRARSGELLQIDGSHHAWFEERGKTCVLLVFIDDATGRKYGKFFNSETTVAYMETMVEYIKKYGRPMAVYSDKHGVFKVNQGSGVKKERITQFGRALKELEIDLICANSPQAKGRVERANGTLQDRLIKEMRLAGICTIEEGNKFLESYWDKHNEQFQVEAVSDENAHRQLVPAQDLKKIFCRKEVRKVTKNLEFQFGNMIYQIKTEQRTRELIRAQITVCEFIDGSIIAEYKGKELKIQKYYEQTTTSEMDLKELEHFLDKKERHLPGKTHPWRQWNQSVHGKRALK
jgi:hypothetical protein